MKSKLKNYLPFLAVVLLGIQMIGAAAFFDNDVQLDVDKYPLIQDEKNSNLYHIAHGEEEETFRLSDMTPKVLGEGHMTIKVPNYMLCRELPLDEKDYMDGYQYVLNEIPNEKGLIATDMERLCVFYFHNKDTKGYRSGLKFPSDKKKTRRIESSIVRNILGKKNTWSEMKLRDRKTYTDTGRTYTYYRDTFEDKNNVTHNVEFVFVPDGTDGICCFLYIYTQPAHRYDALYMLQTLEVTN